MCTTTNYSRGGGGYYGTGAALGTSGEYIKGSILVTPGSTIDVIVAGGGLSLRADCNGNGGRSSIQISHSSQKEGPVDHHSLPLHHGSHPWTAVAERETLHCLPSADRRVAVELVTDSTPSTTTPLPVGGEGRRPVRMA